MNRKIIISIAFALTLFLNLAVPALAAEPEVIPSITVKFNLTQMPDFNSTLTNFYDNFEMIEGSEANDFANLCAADISSSVSFDHDVEITYYTNKDKMTKIVKAGETIYLSDYCNEVLPDRFNHVFSINVSDDNEDKLLISQIRFTVVDKAFAKRYYASENDGNRIGRIYKLEDYAVGLANSPASPAPTPQSQTVNPTASTVYLNGEAINFDAYNISDNNYFKLRDLAYVLNGTEKQFEVGYDESSKAIALTSGKAYTAAGSEMMQGDGKAKNATPTSSKIYLDGNELKLTVYNIGDYNFFKLRDLMEAIDVFVGYDNATEAITLDTSKSYI